MLGCDVLVDHHFDDAAVSRQEADVANCLDDVANIEVRPSLALAVFISSDSDDAISECFFTRITVASFGSL